MKLYRSAVSALVLGAFILSSAIWVGGCSSDPISEGSDPEVMTEGKSEDPVNDAGPDSSKDVMPEVDPDKSKTSISFAKEIEPILIKNCVSCHSKGAGGMTLVAGQMYDKLVGVDSQKAAGWKRVLPGDPAKSFLYNKVSEATPAAGNRMPPKGGPLSDSDIKKIHDWIKSGAAK